MSRHARPTELPQGLLRNKACVFRFFADFGPSLGAEKACSTTLLDRGSGAHRNRQGNFSWRCGGELVGDFRATCSRCHHRPLFQGYWHHKALSALPMMLSFPWEQPGGKKRRINFSFCQGPSPPTVPDESRSNKLLKASISNSAKCGAKALPGAGALTAIEWLKDRTHHMYNKLGQRASQGVFTISTRVPGERARVGPGDVAALANPVGAPT